MQKNQIVEYFNQQKQRIITEWIELLSFASIGTDSAFDADCEKCAEWLKAQVEKIGFKAELLKTATKPVLYGELSGASDKPSILFYGHYDVQPADPLDLWKSEPFKPELRGDRLYARGAQDNKGQLFYFLKAVEFLKSQALTLPTIKLLIEGEEESGSRQIDEKLPEWSSRIQADILMICDTGTLIAGVPTITVGLRGIASTEVILKGPKSDLHSGVFGGLVYNTAQAAAELAASFHNADGSVAIDGFYDGVPLPSEEEKRLALSIPIPLSALEQEIGVPFTGGEKKFSPLERRSFRPTLEINGIGSGYQGAGGKTIIPKEAVLKITMRLSAGQVPEKILENFKKHVAAHVPLGITYEIPYAGSPGGSLKVDLASSAVVKARTVLKEAFGVEPLLMWEGASIPIIPKLQKYSGGLPLLVGFGVTEDEIHAPNESFSLTQFQDGLVYVSCFLSSL